MGAPRVRRVDNERFVGGAGRLSTAGAALAVALLGVFTAVFAMSAPAAAQLAPDPDAGTLFLSTFGNGDPSALPANLVFTVTSTCLASPLVISTSTASTFSGDPVSPGAFAELVIDVIDDANGRCEFTITAPPTPGFDVVPSASQTFTFGPGDFAEANVAFTFLDEPTGSLEIGMQAWDRTEAEYLSGPANWAPASTWTFDTLPSEWNYEVTSPCLAAPIQLTLDAVSTGPTYRSSASADDLPIADAAGNDCVYTTTLLPPPGWTVAPRPNNAISQTTTLLPSLFGNTSYLLVKTNDGYPGGAEPGVSPALVGAETSKTDVSVPVRPAVVLGALTLSAAALLHRRRDLSL